MITLENVFKTTLQHKERITFSSEGIRLWGFVLIWFRTLKMIQYGSLEGCVTKADLYSNQLYCVCALGFHWKQIHFWLGLRVDAGEWAVERMGECGNCMQDRWERWMLGMSQHNSRKNSLLRSHSQILKIVNWIKITDVKQEKKNRGTFEWWNTASEGGWATNGSEKPTLPNWVGKWHKVLKECR